MLAWGAGGGGDSLPETYKDRNDCNGCLFRSVAVKKTELISELLHDSVIITCYDNYKW